ncbi:YhdH/YhfP family quinone oxidoreductase [Desulfonema magnum]|uniref:Quinone oxidoreductase, YhdH/YhfP family n=1 Tax=Desulfonema magnum TaxID=45655 RepID=A0A975BXG4_9BACT|nr:YhdH/YhfP family quinone oxidoreductase [Desulfonema magnum]QTA93518.1 Putative quinone oxidoreductase, YhdH/YhfP family [Desulfonema magnum]
MALKTFKAMLVKDTGDNRYTRQIVDKSVEELPPGDVLVNVRYSSLNYKDALSAIGNKGVTKKYPHTPGIDAAGIVAESSVPEFSPGDEVIVTSYDLGMNTSGGFGQYIRVPAGWVVPLPGGLTLRESMIYGTAGFTAALSVFRLKESGITPDRGDVLVSGATGGVGSIAVSILSQIGYSVTAVNGISDKTAYLRKIGAKSVISIEAATDQTGRPLLKERWAGSIDAVGGDILVTTIKSTAHNGTVTCCGNIASPEMPLNVYPFILRGVRLIGIGSQNCPMPVRRKIWEKIAGEWKIVRPDPLTSEISLDELDHQIEMMLQRKRKGRTLVRMTE